MNIKEPPPSRVAIAMTFNSAIAEDKPNNKVTERLQVRTVPKNTDTDGKTRKQKQQRQTVASGILKDDGKTTWVLSPDNKDMGA
ncbi:hypothetical protein [Novipirellula rosea]|uniref:Uncharacterized protein n=1 Tax=Novipirellula rosea TaxID=1031540 RepID=A0ABP8NLJ6_9BACT